jgi:hypothetical protein
MRVVVLFHARERDVDPAGYLVHHFDKLWREDGLEVVYLYGTERFAPTDLVLVHVALSVVPEPYLEFAACYPIVLNGRARDIRKSVASRYLVQPDDDWFHDVSRVRHAPRRAATAGKRDPLVLRRPQAALGAFWRPDRTPPPGVGSAFPPPSRSTLAADQCRRDAGFVRTCRLVLPAGLPPGQERRRRSRNIVSSSRTPSSRHIPKNAA